MFSEIDDKSVVKSVDFLEEIGILYDSLIYLLENSKMLLIFMESQLDLAKVITILEIVITNIKKWRYRSKWRRKKKEIIAEQESVLNKVKVLFQKRERLIEQFGKNNIISKDKKYYYVLEKSEESIQSNQNKNLINQFLNGCIFQKIDLIL